MPNRSRRSSVDSSSSTAAPPQAQQSPAQAAGAQQQQGGPSPEGSQTPMLDGVESQVQNHTVAKGENLWVIAQRFGVTVHDLQTYNGIRNPNRLSVGQELRVPPARTEVADEAPGDDVYFVRRGDNLDRIAKRFGTSVREIARANGISDINFIDVGQALKIPGVEDVGQASAAPKVRAVQPGNEQVHTVVRGDTLSRLAKRFGTTVSAIASMNGISNPNRLRVGQKLKMPGTSTAGSGGSGGGAEGGSQQTPAPQTEQGGAEQSGGQETSGQGSEQSGSLDQDVAESTGLSESQGQDVEVGPALQAVINAVVGVAPKHEYARDSVPRILRQAVGANVRNANQVAYILATAEHETDFGKPTFSRSETLVEDSNGFSQRGGQWRATNHVSGRRNTAGSRSELETKYWDDAYGGRLGNRKGTTDAANYRGRGYVQLTGRTNYDKMTKELNREGFTYELDGVVWGKDKPIDLVANPTHVNKSKDLAARCLVDGMMDGMFTGAALGSYVNDRKADFYNARSVVNGDKRKNGRSIQRTANRYAGALGNWASVFRDQA